MKWRVQGGLGGGAIILPFNTCLLSIFHVSSTVLGVETENEPDRTLCPLAVYVLANSGLMALSPHKNVGPPLPLLLLFGKKSQKSGFLKTMREFEISRCKLVYAACSTVEHKGLLSLSYDKL